MVVEEVLLPISSSHINLPLSPSLSVLQFHLLFCLPSPPSHTQPIAVPYLPLHLYISIPACCFRSLSLAKCQCWAGMPPLLINLPTDCRGLLTVHRLGVHNS